MKRTIRNTIITYIVLIVSFVVSLTLAYSIPSGRIINNVKESINKIEEEGVYPRLFFKNEVAQLDNFTDTLMLILASYDSDNSSIKAAMENAYVYTKDYNDSIIDELNAYLSGEESEKSEYSRYWHGYLTFLKPLLYFFNYLEIRYINMFLLFALFVLVNILINKKLGFKYMVAFFLSIMMSMFLIVPMSIQFSSMYYLMFIGNIILLCKYDYLKDKRWIHYLFFAIGGLTSYLDLLTAPLITLGMPLITYVLLLNKENKFLSNFYEIICKSVMWTLGYSSIWATKWIVGSIILGRNILTAAMNQVEYRSSSTSRGYEIIRSSVIKKNIDLYFNDSIISILGVILIVLIILLIFNKERILFIKGRVSVLIIAVYPIVWFIVLANHTDIHFWFTYRILMVSAYSFFSFILSCIDFKRLHFNV